MASVLKQTVRGKKTANWYVVYNDANGKQKWVKGYTDKVATEKLARQLEDEKQHIQNGDIDPQAEAEKTERGRTIGSHIQSFETSLKAAARDVNHVRYTVGDIRAFVLFNSVTNVNQIVRTMMDDWVIYLSAQDEKYREWVADGREGPIQGEPNAARTINRRIGSVQSFLLWCKAARVLVHYNLWKYPKREVRGQAVRESRSFTDAEITKLLEWAKVNSPEHHDIYLFALDTGFRAGEVQSMTPAAFDFERNSITVHSKDTRNHDRVDSVPMHNELVEMLKKRCTGKLAAERLFDLPDHSAEVLQRDCLAAGIDGKDVTFHGLRHTFITRMARKNIHPKITQTLARHRDLEMTLRYYTHWSTDDEKAALNSMTSAAPQPKPQCPPVATS